ncbi:MAG: ABC transporter permease [Firmicutes bacterium]|nr:ABC transporter permease [Bacillota bacterium]
MSVTLAILKRSLIETSRSKTNLLFMILLPLLFTFVLGVAPGLSNATSGVALVNEGSTPVSQAYASALLTHYGQGTRLVAASQYKALLRDQTVSDVILLPPSLTTRALAGRALAITIISAPGTGANGGSAANFTFGLQTAISRWTLAGRETMLAAAHHGASRITQWQAFARGIRQAPPLYNPISVLAQSLFMSHTTSSLTIGQQSVVGFATMFIIFTIFGYSSNLLTEKETGTWSRLKASSASPMAIVTGYGGILFLMGWIQFFVLVLASRLLFGIFVPMSGWMVLIVSLYCLAESGIALCVAGLVKTAQQLSAIGSFVAIITSMLGGAYWSLSLEPVWMQHVGWFVPQSWTIQAFQTLVAGAGSFHSLEWPIAVLFSFAMIFFTAGVAQLRYA